METRLPEASISPDLPGVPESAENLTAMANAAALGGLAAAEQVPFGVAEALDAPAISPDAATLLATRKTCCRYTDLGIDVQVSD
jgi:hypothetical protein